MQEYADFHVFLKTCGLNKKNRKYAKDYISLKGCWIPKKHVVPGSLVTNSIFVNFIVEEKIDYPIFGEFVHRDILLSHTIYLQQSTKNEKIETGFTRYFKYIRKQKSVPRFAIIGIVGENNEFLTDLIKYFEENDVVVIKKFGEYTKILHFSEEKVSLGYWEKEGYHKIEFNCNITNDNFVQILRTKKIKLLFESYTDNNITIEKYKRYFINGNIMKNVNYKGGKLDGSQKKYYPNGKIKQSLNYKNGKFEGIEKYFDNNFRTRQYLNYKDGLLDGAHIEYYTDGEIKIYHNYKKGELDGCFKEFIKNGNIIRDYNYKNGELDGIQNKYEYDHENTNICLKSTQREFINGVLKNIITRFE